MSKKHKKPSEVFLSHSTIDRALAKRVVSFFHTQKINLWYSPKHIVGATEWHDEIGRALARCDWFLIVLTPNSVKSRWVKKELLYALDEPRYEDRIIPLLAKTCKFNQLSWTLKQIEVVDLRQGFSAGCDALLKIWGIPRKRAGVRRR
jgi:hypothetical protein